MLIDVYNTSEKIHLMVVWNWRMYTNVVRLLCASEKGSVRRQCGGTSAHAHRNVAMHLVQFGIFEARIARGHAINFRSVTSSLNQGTRR